MALILDTNALSAFVDGDEALLRAIESEAELAIPTVVLGEYLYGISQSKKRAAYQAWISTNLPFFDVIPIDRETAERYSEIRCELKAAGTPIPTNDLWIAAVVRHHRIPLVTRDGHFRAIQDLRVVMW